MEGDNIDCIAEINFCTILDTWQSVERDELVLTESTKSDQAYNVQMLQTKLRRSLMDKSWGTGHCLLYDFSVTLLPSSSS